MPIELWSGWLALMVAALVLIVTVAWRKARAAASGEIESLWSCASTASPMAAYAELTCVRGVGIRGDRYSTDIVAGRYSGKPELGRQLTLVTAEGLARAAAARREGSSDSSYLGGALAPHNCRRNVVCRGLELDAPALVGREIALGDSVVAFVHRPTVPCMYLEGTVKQKGVMEDWWYDAGLSCEIVRGGVIRRGDVVRVLPTPVDIARCQTWAPFLLKKPSGRSADEKSAVLRFREEIVVNSKTPEEELKSKKRQRLFDQAMGRKNAQWDGGSPQW